MSVPHNLKLIRARLGLSQEAFAQRMEVTKGMINKYEQAAAFPQVDFLLKLQYLTGLPIEWIIYHDLTPEAFPENMDIENIQEPAEAYRRQRNLYDIRTLVEVVKEMQAEIEALKKRQNDEKQE